MSYAALAQPHPSQAPVRAGGRGIIAIVLAVWLALVSLLGAQQAFVGPEGAPPIRLVVAAAGPVIIFLAAVWLSRGFREFLLRADLRLVVGVQAWRFAGFGFLALYAQHVLPGAFAWPAGVGDMFIGLTAPLLMLALIRNPGVVASKTFVAWNVFGILDLVVALGSGALGAALTASAASGVVATMTPMAHLPLVLIPTFLVPVFVMLHVAALLQSRQARALARAR
ncbi:MAG TPA: hypothetical protein VFW98_08650 [Gemmatimonadaceae bacterium]|nr:hypothetical protein [Gemmatimonadaceae bacterium]